MSGSLVFPAQPLPHPLAPCRAPILPPDLLFCQRDKPRDSARALKRASDAGFSEFTFGASPPQARVLHLAPPPRPPPCCLPGEQPWSPETPQGEQAGCSGDSLFCSLCSRGLLQGAAEPEGPRSAFFTEPAGPGGQRLLRDVTQHHLIPRPRGTCHPGRAQELRREADRHRTASSERGSGGLVLPRAQPPTRLQLCGWLARWSWIPCSSCCPPLGGLRFCTPPFPPRSPTPQQGPRVQLPLGERTGVGAQRCRHQAWGPGQFDSIGL